MGAAAGVAAVGTIVDAGSRAAEGRARSSAKTREAAAMRIEAQNVLNESRRQAGIFRQESDVAFGDQVSSFAKAGVDFSGSPLMVLAGSKRDIEDNISDIITRGDREAASLRSGASNARREASSFSRAGTIGAGASLLTGTARLIGD